MIGQEIVYKALADLDIKFEYYESPRDFSSEDDGAFWKRIGACRCKNLFMRNHKGNQHYLLISDYYRDINIHAIEHKLKQGKLSFASQERIDKWIKGTIGAISVFSLLNDTENHTIAFIDKTLLTKGHLTFLPNQLNALISISIEDFVRILDYSGNRYEFVDLEAADEIEA